MDKKYISFLRLEAMIRLDQIYIEVILVRWVTTNTLIINFDRSRNSSLVSP